MSRSTQQWEFLQDVAKLVVFIKASGWKATGGELYRTLDQQKIYVETGLSQTLDSQHLKRLAIDLNFFTPSGVLTYEKSELQLFGDYWESLHKNNRWGGNWESFLDTPHFERNNK